MVVNINTIYNFIIAEPIRHIYYIKLQRPFFCIPPVNGKEGGREGGKEGGICGRNDNYIEAITKGEREGRREVGRKGGRQEGRDNIVFRIIKGAF